MSHNQYLQAAKDAKNDEFYTQYSDIEKEISGYLEHDPHVFENKTILCPCDDPNQSNFTKYFIDNFNRFGLKKLISACYRQNERGRLFVRTCDGKFTDWLEGDGDFRSAEVTALRDEADVIITNPPFSLFREFLAWILEAGKQFAILGNMNAITYKEVFPHLKNNEIWLGYKSLNQDMYFNVPDERKQWLVEHKKEGSAYKIIGGVVMGRLASACWFTNLDHNKRHEPLLLDTMEHNLKFNKRLRKKLEKDYGKLEYPHYDNYDAIEVPFVEAIPSDYNGVMGVPITFLDKYDPEQFEIVAFRKGEDGKDLVFTRERERERVQPYFRILVRRR